MNVDPAPDMRQVEQLTGRPDYGVAFCVGPWPDGGWIAGVALTDREWIEEQVGDGDILPGLLNLPDGDPFPDFDIIDGFKEGVNAHGSTMAEAIDLLFTKVLCL
jgi:hypothetical protein